jgi:hypothetical protein
MTLTLRPSGLGSGIDKDRPDYTVYCGEWGIGRIYQTRGGPDSMRWFWSRHGIFGKPADMRTDGHAATLDQAKSHGGNGWRGRGCRRVVRGVPMLIIELRSRLRERPVESTPRRPIQRSPDTAGLFIGCLFQGLALDITC